MSNQQRRTQFSVNIDFDESREAWRENKQALKNGQFAYICGTKTKDGSKCKRKLKNGQVKCFAHL